MFDRFTNGYVKVAGFFARKLIISIIILGRNSCCRSIPRISKFLQDLFPKKTRDISSSPRSCPDALHWQRTDDVTKKIEAILKHIP
jgi:HAE1 family hydrophobic/amphiphilic exporter-1